MRSLQVLPSYSRNDEISGGKYLDHRLDQLQKTLTKFPNNDNKVSNQKTFRFQKIRHVEIINMVEEAELGRRIQQYRINNGLTLQELAEKTGLTKGYLSKIENAEKAPPVSTLINIAKALNISISEIFGEVVENSPICLVKKSERHNIVRDGTVFGYAYQALAHKFRNKHMEPYVLTLPLHPKENALFQHKGEEILFVLEGTMRFFHGEKEFIVEEGDCIYFDGSIPHYGVCKGNKEAKCFMVIYTPE